MGMAALVRDLVICGWAGGLQLHYLRITPGASKDQPSSQVCFGICSEACTVLNFFFLPTECVHKD